MGVRCTKAGALSNKLSRPFRLNQRYGNGGVRVRAWQTVASDGQVFAAFYAFACNKAGRPISKRFAADNEAPLGANASRASSESLSHRVMSPHQTDQGIK